MAFGTPMWVATVGSLESFVDASFDERSLASESPG
jgi:hypothetical protein